MSPSGRDRDGPLCRFLASHVGIVDGVSPKRRDRVAPIEGLRMNLESTAEESDRFRQ